MQYESITGFLEIPGFQIVDIRQAERKGYKAAIVYLERVQDSYKCGGCGQEVQDSQQAVIHSM